MDNKIVWGMTLGMTRAFFAHVYESVEVTAEELGGAPRLKPSRLITRTGLLSRLGTQGPYTKLVDRLEKEAVDRSAILTFPYDWRLSIDFNAAILADSAKVHLTRWRETLKQIVYEADGPLGNLNVDTIKLTFVAHSMGGLIARQACTDPALASSVRRIISLGTPYRGSAKTVAVLNAGQTGNWSLDDRAARRLAVTCPGVYDLLPREPCIRESDKWREITPSDVHSMGASEDLAKDAAARWAKIDPDQPVANVETLPIIGSAQPTPRTLAVVDSVWHPEAVDWEGYLSLGDGTVADSNPPNGVQAHAYVAGHEQLADTPVTIEAVVRHLRGIAEPPRTLAPPRELGLSVPLVAGQGVVTAHITEVGFDKPKRSGISVTSSTETPAGLWNKTVDWYFTGVKDGRLVCNRPLGPGIHRVNVTGGGSVGVSRTIAVLTDG